MIRSHSPRRSPRALSLRPGPSAASSSRSRSASIRGISRHENARRISTSSAVGSARSASRGQRSRHAKTSAGSADASCTPASSATVRSQPAAFPLLA